MHNLYAIFAKFLEICKRFSKNLVNEQGNIPRRGVVSRFSDLEVVALNLTAEAFHSYDLIKAAVHDINYLNDVKWEYHDCSIFGDRGYISKSVRLDLFETANIRLEVPYRLNQKDWKPRFIPFAKARKRIETTFSQLTPVHDDKILTCPEKYILLGRRSISSPKSK